MGYMGIVIAIIAVTTGCMLWLVSNIKGYLKQRQQVMDSWKD